jgi:5'-deoxynucleotidase YfbR-like HD superfamily hydrolase
MKENLDAGNKIRTYTGKYIDVFDMNIEDIDIIDIAHSLSLSSRWNGHTKEHYSIAEHSIWMANNANTLEEKMECLIHDATEAYIVDVPSPIKRRLPQYIEVEEKLNKIICEKFNIKYPFSKKLKELDRKSLEFEWNNKVLNNNFKSMTSEISEKTFLDMFFEIEGEIKKEKLLTFENKI